MIEKRGGKHVLLSGLGKVLGRHKRREQAEAQERAITIHKARKAGHHIPKPKGY